MMITVRDCTCPSVELSSLDNLCISDQDIDLNGRTGRKPIPWTLGYDTDTDRLDLYNVTATMINFKTLYL